MKIKLLYPEIRTSEPSYHTTNTSLVVNLGINTSHRNIAEDFVQPMVRVFDAVTGVDLQGGPVSVRLNSFSTEYLIENLEPNKLYVLEIDSLYNRIYTTIISTLTDNSAITVVGREKIFSHESRFYGRDIERPVYAPGPLDFRKGLDLINNTAGASLVVEDGQLYTFCPSHLITTLQHYPNTISYQPLPGFDRRNIKVVRVVNVVKHSSTVYEVVPPTRMRIINTDEGKDIITPQPIRMINLQDYGIPARNTILQQVVEP